MAVAWPYSLLPTPYSLLATPYYLLPTTFFSVQVIRVCGREWVGLHRLPGFALGYAAGSPATGSRLPTTYGLRPGAV